jgi:hypothetical protein
MSSKKGRYLSDATIAAYRQQTQRNAAQTELARWIRFSDDEAETTCDGLTPATMEIGGLAGFYLRHFMNSNDVTGARFKQGGIEVIEKQAREGAGFLIITSTDTTRTAQLDAGRRFERMTLLLREMGLAGHPMSQLLEEDPWRSELTRELGVTEPPQFIVRIGHVEASPLPVSHRRPWYDFVTFKRRS